MRTRLAALFAALFVLVLAACGQSQPAGPPDPPPSPFLYEILSEEGAGEGWLFGTIHALPDQTYWHSPALDQAMGQADLLMVEVKALDDRRAIQQVFTRLAFSKGLAPLRARIAPSAHAKLDHALALSDLGEDDLDQMESWAAALILARAASPGQSANGVDRALIRDFAARGSDIIEFEGAARQFSIFDTLAEEDQRALLIGVLTQASKPRAERLALQDAWLKGDEPALVAAMQNGILADPELYQALLAKRNQAWMEPLLTTLSGQAKPLVAVGAGHLVGPDGLPALLEARGFTVTRIQ